MKLAATIVGCSCSQREEAVGIMVGSYMLAYETVLQTLSKRLYVDPQLIICEIELLAKGIKEKEAFSI